jgi:hypothetical protein
LAAETGPRDRNRAENRKPRISLIRQNTHFAIGT